MKKAQKQDIIQNGRLEFYTHSYIPQAMIYNVTIILCGCRNGYRIPNILPF